MFLARLLVYLRGISNIHCTRCKKQQSKLHVSCSFVSIFATHGEYLLHSLRNNKVLLCLSRSFVSIFVIHDEYLLHSLRNNKVNFVYLVRLLVYLQVGAATINCI